ncbi:MULTISPECIES: hypothetical protein [unclassified Gemella]|uniref:hypothetical protein n=1 Tax=unclassified Gemella TaxID=2624949 RepID=UPI001C04B9E5|nr:MULTISPECIES: hypothetical protein [unclassified Gemella]MBU0279011.1 hypothetical protein [Gemella sp. zg-1178]QWQ39083.1 hypothetical protein KMP11_01760 [Gemella sp. zg-570]
MKKYFYKYDENLIKFLGYKDLVCKYSLDNDNINEAIYFATSSLDKHIKAFFNVKLSSKEILLGDFFSFEYYSLFLNDLSKLSLLSSVMKKNYLLLLKKDISNLEIIDLAISLPSLLFCLYNKEFSFDEKVFFLRNFYDCYKEYLSDLLKREVQLQTLIEEFNFLHA